MIEIWDPESHEMPEGDGRLTFDLMSDTDYFELNANSLFAKETYALAMQFSNDGKLLAIFARDQKIRIFNFNNGKLLRLLDETFE